MPIRQNGTRTAHSARWPSAISPGVPPGSPTPARRMPRLMIQNDSTGFDQNTSGSRGDPGHHRLM